MSRNYKFYDQDRLYFVTYATVGWIDIFTRPEYKKIVLDSLEHCSRQKGLEIYAWCIMTNHIHLIIGTHCDKMENILHDHKSFTAKAIISEVLSNREESRKEWIYQLLKAAGAANSNNTNYQFWQQHNRPIELYTPAVIMQKLDYIHNNPVVAGFVERPEDWLYSSARDYEGRKGLLSCLTPIDVAMRG